MNPKRKRRLIAIVLLVAGIGTAVGLLTYAFRQNINVYYSPEEIASGNAPIGRRIRAGGLVVAGSVHRDQESLKVRFDVTDNKSVVTIEYEGILPDLFREGQGIIALGRLTEAGVVVADEVLAKHDENYMPPEVQKVLEKSAAGHSAGSE